MSPSVAPVRRSGSIARRNARSRAVVTTSSVSQRYYRACPALRPLGLSQGRRAPAPGGLDNQRQAGRAIWQREGLKVPLSNPQRGRLWLADGSCIRLRPGAAQDRLHRAGQPWENGYIESFNARLRDELLNGDTLRKAQMVIESWRPYYNTIRPHASIGYKPPAPEVFAPTFAA